MNVRPPGGRFDRRRPEQGLRINHRIRVPEVRVISEEEQLGILPTHEALRLAEEKGLDLVEISPRAFPPVCRIMDYGKYKYEEAKKKEHDMAFKVKHIRRFLEGGNKVRLAVVFRGREITHPKTGMNVLDRVVELCNDIATVEATPNMEGRRMIMVIAPKPGVVRKAMEAKKAQVAAQMAAEAAKKNPQPGKPAQPAPPPPDEDDDLDEDAINADVEDDDEE
jgi:translation initiation factor IF-3